MAETDLVVTLADDGSITGQIDRTFAHRSPGILHLAVSVQVVDHKGRWLLQKRAPGKALFAQQWANSCCTHPRPGETVEAAVRRRLSEELGLRPEKVTPAGQFQYLARDASTGFVEHELDHVFVALIEGNPTVNPDEIDDVVCLPLDDASKMLSGPHAAPWAADVFRHATRAWYERGKRPRRE